MQLSYYICYCLASIYSIELTRLRFLVDDFIILLDPQEFDFKRVCDAHAEMKTEWQKTQKRFTAVINGYSLCSLLHILLQGYNALLSRGEDWLFEAFWLVAFVPPFFFIIYELDITNQRADDISDAVKPLLTSQNTGIEALKLHAFLEKEQLSVELLYMRVSVKQFVYGAVLLGVAQIFSQYGFEWVF